jgi:quaternary ammonium compound-resistance protein SugE
VQSIKVEEMAALFSILGHMNWIILFTAGLCEIIWLMALKYSEGFTKLLPAIITVLFLALSMILLSVSLKTIPVGTAYGIWTGIGAVGGAILGIVLFGESKELLRLFFIFLIVTGIVGLKLMTKQID